MARGEKQVGNMLGASLMSRDGEGFFLRELKSSVLGAMFNDGECVSNLEEVKVGERSVIIATVERTQKKLYTIVGGFYKTVGLAFQSFEVVGNELVVRVGAKKFVLDLEDGSVIRDF
jgi:hypothetical protein